MSFSYPSVPLLLPSASSSVRLLTLLPSKDANATPTCSIRAVELDSAPPFKALSYTWGDEKQRTTIRVNSTDLSITTDLAVALRHLRLPDHERRLWIDQICINQSDDDEKASQVQLMRRIYSQAEQTVAWLGESADGSDEVMRFVRDAGAEALRVGLRDVPKDDYAALLFHVTAAFGRMRGSDVPVEEGDPLGRRKLELARLIDSKYWRLWDRRLDQLYALFARPYFRRGWIKQEVVIPAALVLQCGHQTVGGDEFVSFVRFDSYIQEAKRQRWRVLVRGLQQNAQAATDRFDSLAGLARAEALRLATSKGLILKSDKFNQRFGLGQTVGIRSRFHMGGALQSEMTLAFILKTFASELLFSNPRDRVFGLLGMASDTDMLHIQVDYTLAWELVYADAIKRIVYAGNVNILSLLYSPPPPPPPPPQTTKLPSWTPDLNTAQTSLIEKYTFMSTRPFSAGGRIPLAADKLVSAAQQFSSPASLFVRGLILDTIHTVGPGWLPDAAGSYFSNDLHSLKNVIATLRDYAAHAAHARTTCIQDPPAPDHPARRIIHRRDDTAAAAALRTACLDHESIDPSSPGRRRRATTERLTAALAQLDKGGQVLGRELQDFVNHAQVLWETAPFLGQGVFIGQGPREMKKGDLVAVLYGARVPFILRPVGGKQGRQPYRLVGEAYCDTVMDGEALGMGLEEVVFELV